MPKNWDEHRSDWFENQLSENALIDADFDAFDPSEIAEYINLSHQED